MKQSGRLYLNLKQQVSEEVKAMELEEDAYGQEMWAYYKGKEVFEIVERDDGYIQASATTKVYFSEYEDWRSSEKKAMEFVKGKVLDIGCGAGRHSLHLQKKGFEVLGIDVSPLAIKICKLQGVKQAEIMIRSHHTDTSTNQGERGYGDSLSASTFCSSPLSSCFTSARSRSRRC